MGPLTALLLLTTAPLCLPYTLPQQEAGGARHLTGAMVYLMKYGYMDLKTEEPKKSASLLSADGMKSYIEEFQAFANLTVTGELDEDTLEMMQRPRCGVKDVIGHGSSREKRYALQGSRWKVRSLTYRVSKYPTYSSLTDSEVDTEIAKALQIWADVTDLTFTRKDYGSVHINIAFNKYNHGDGDPFDGSGGTLAHAYFPVYGGDAHFDDSEYWTVNSYKGTNLLQTAAHEFGHSLGLSHSDQFSALMAPFYRGYQSKVKLDEDDVEAIQALYGKNSGEKEKPSSSQISFPTSTAKPQSTGRVGRGERGEELCTNSSLDSILTTMQGDTFTFRGDQYWKLTEDAIASGYPQPISHFWKGLPSSIDASFTWTNGKSYFFKGDKYWRHSEDSMDKGYPKPISEGFEGIPDNLDAAFVWSGNGKIYFFKGSQYWKFDPEREPHVLSSYPKPISNWEGIPNDIDEAIQYTNGYTYFFKNGFYYRFNDRSFQVDTADPPFPRPVGYWWFGCTSQERSGSPMELQQDQPRADVALRGAEGGDEHLDSEGASRRANFSSGESIVGRVSSIWLLVASMVVTLSH